MLDKIDLSKSLSKEESKEQIEKLGMALAELQREAKSLGIPVMIVFEGWGAAGKGTLINRLIQPMDPRGFKVHTIKEASEEEAMRPFLWRFWTKTPARGRIYIYDRSWYRRVINDRMDQNMSKEELANAYNEINFFEEQLVTDDNLIIKLFLHISKKEQKKRFKKLEASPETKWRVTKDDWKHNEQYDEYLTAYDEMIEHTDSKRAPWTVIEATDRRYAEVKILATVVSALRIKIAEVKAKKDKSGSLAETVLASVDKVDEQYRTRVLAGVDLDKSLSREEYKKRIKELQDRLEKLHGELYKHRIPVVLAFEGWDAGGKGGAIKRLTQKLDPRGYEVVPTSAANDTERAHHYLWRFWNKVPKAGHIAIFDRTWYGRVMVERIEGFCTTDEWMRAYKEINQMEEDLTNFGTIVLKFWMHIDKDEQERRFNERMNTPEKQWKITDEDWRNRAKWDIYEKCVDEMIVKTSTTNAPWIVVEGNDKCYARVKVLETVVKAIEERLKEIDKK